MQTITDLMDMARAANGRARTRTLTHAEAQEMLDLITHAAEDTHTIRVYSRDGFVPNSYFGRADIRYFEAKRQTDGTFTVIATYTGAKRSHGNGALVTINSRSA
jgi:hypothetical protein